MSDIKLVDKPTGLALLRQPFPAHQVSKLPKPFKADSPKGKCLPKGKGGDAGPQDHYCGGYHGLPAVHLDYVGHAALTDRLLDADPLWTWGPLAVSADGLPAYDEFGGLWIKLTVCGVTRLGYGNAARKTYMDVGAREKEVIGDALRNAGMRFGAALDLWHKGDLHADNDEDTGDQEKRTPWTDELLDLAKEAAAKGMPAYQAFWKSLTAETQSVLARTTEHAEFKNTATAVAKAA